MDTMFDKLVTPEEQEKMARAIWEKAKEDIVKNVEYAILSEMRINMNSITRRLVQQEFKAVLAPLLAAKKEEIQSAAKEVINKVASNLNKAVVNEIRWALRSDLDNLATQLGSTLSDQIRSAVGRLIHTDKTLNDMFKEEPKET